MPDKKMLYIHAGMGKTGSTSIQEMFYCHQNYFWKQGIYYPFTGEMHCHHDVISDYFEKKIFWRTTDHYIDLLKKDISSKKPQKCLLSSELFYLRLDKKEVVERIKDIFKDYQVQIIVYVRRADKSLPSAYKQQVMGFRYRELNKDFWYVDHIEKLSGIKAAWGISNKDIIIRPFEKQQFYQNDLLKDFLDIIQVRDPKGVSDSMKTLNVKVNLSLDMIEYVRLMSMHVDHIDRTELSAWQRLLTEYPATQEYEDVSLFGSHENLEETMNLYAPMYEHIAKEYLGRPDAKMFYEEPPPDKEHFKPYSGLSIDEIAKINGYLYYKIGQEYISKAKSSRMRRLRHTIYAIIKRFRCK